MRDNRDEVDYIKIDIKSFQDICGKVETLEKENEFLQSKLELKERILEGCKLNNSKITQERNQLQAELDRIKSMTMFEFGNVYCSTESLEADGHAFARALLGKPMTPEDIDVAITEAENGYKPYTAEDF